MINFYNGQHAYYCGVDLHKKTMYVYIISHDGEAVFHKNIRTRPDEFLRAVAPFRQGLVVAVECMTTGAKVVFGGLGLPFHQTPGTNRLVRAMYAS